MEETKKRCPYCGEEIMAVAKKCKHCGSWLDKEEATQELPAQCSERQILNHSPKNRRYAVATIVAGLCIVGAFIAFHLNKTNVNSNESPSESSVVQEEAKCPSNWEHSVFEGRICVSTSIDGMDISTEVRGEDLIVYLTNKGEIIMTIKDKYIPENYYLSFNQNGSPAIIPCEIRDGAIYIQAPEAIKKCLELFDYEEMDIAIVDADSNGYSFTYSGATKDAEDAMNYITQSN